MNEQYHKQYDENKVVGDEAIEDNDEAIEDNDEAIEDNEIEDTKIEDNDEAIEDNEIEDNENIENQHDKNTTQLLEEEAIDSDQEEELEKTQVLPPDDEEIDIDKELDEQLFNEQNHEMNIEKQIDDVLAIESQPEPADSQENKHTNDIINSLFANNIKNDNIKLFGRKQTPKKVDVELERGQKTLSELFNKKLTVKSSTKQSEPEIVVFSDENEQSEEEEQEIKPPKSPSSSDSESENQKPSTDYMNVETIDPHSNESESEEQLTEEQIQEQKKLLRKRALQWKQMVTKKIRIFSLFF